jgi:hypothetical protein
MGGMLAQSMASVKRGCRRTPRRQNRFSFDAKYSVNDDILTLTCKKEAKLAPLQCL